MYNTDLKIALKLSLVYSFNLLGMFLLLPVMVVYAGGLEGGNIQLAGFAFGCYGLMRLFMQLPLGMLSDSIGRKKIIYFGLMMVVIGSCVCANSSTIYMLIAGRLIQGIGAVGAVVTALMADITSEENRTKVMAIIGAGIGVSFSISLICSPILALVIGVRGMFYLIAILALLSMLIVSKFIPNPDSFGSKTSSSRLDFNKLKKVISNLQLLRLNFGVFSLHFTQMSLFVALPLFFAKSMNLDKFQQAYIYLPAVITGFVLMVPFVVMAEKKSLLKQVMIIAIVMILIAQILLMFEFKYSLILSSILALYFVGFNILEASLPSLISKFATLDSKGTALGMQSTCQSLGLFLGSSFGGYLYQHFGLEYVYFECTIVLLLWLFLALTMQEPKRVKTIVKQVPDNWKDNIDQLISQLRQVTGVHEIFANQDQSVLYFKVSQSCWDEVRFNRVFLEGSYKWHEVL